ncbi:isopentenyl transferase family protein [Streptomyces sp. NPDC101455]|uniref:isopentenyl transferase family protein n=1 Tax=Streptomyces sp. NPDC101455 TaxID=3366142 RepID=UPI00381DE427
MKQLHSTGQLTVHVIAGPTGVGKSSSASELALQTGAPVVVADRIQCFTDLTTTSARAGADVPGVRRIWLGDRTVADGDYPAEQAAETLVEKVQGLARTAPTIIVEGGSISILRLLTERIPQLPWTVVAHLLTRPPDRGDYLTRLTERAHRMLCPTPPQQGLLDELAALWRDPAQQRFVASVNGMEAALEWCAEFSIPPTYASTKGISRSALDRLAHMIAERHAEHGADQEREFLGILSHLLPDRESRFTS